MVPNDSMPALVTRISIGPELGAHRVRTRRRPRPGRPRRPTAEHAQFLGEPLDGRRPGCRRPRPGGRRRRSARRPRPMPEAPPVTTATRLMFRSPRGSNQVQLTQAAEDPRRLVLEAAGAGRTVVLPIRMSCIRSRMRSRPRAPRRGRAGHRGRSGCRDRRRCAPARSGDRRNSSGTRTAGVAVGGRGSIIGVPAAMSTPPTVVVRTAGGRRSHRALDPEHLLEEVGDGPVSARSSSCSSGCSARCFSAAASSRAVVSWPAAKRNVAVRTTVSTSGMVPSG